MLIWAEFLVISFMVSTSMTLLWYAFFKSNSREALSLNPWQRLLLVILLNPCIPVIISVIMNGGIFMMGCFIRVSFTARNAITRYDYQHVDAYHQKVLVECQLSN